MAADARDWTRSASGLAVFTDLDGTLLDHRTYSYGDAQLALDRLAALRVPVVLASSKTAAEIAPLRAELDLAWCPAIVENGAGVLEPGTAEDPMHGEEDHYVRLRGVLDAMPRALRDGFRGFGDMTEVELAQETGLSLSSATLAKKRRFSEPGVWAGDPTGRDAFMDAVCSSGMVAHQGGRFLTLSFGGDKSERVAGLSEMIKPDPVRIVLGDAPNDEAMLSHADYAVVIANRAHDRGPDLPASLGDRVIRSDLEGPAGWNETMVRLIAEHERGRLSRRTESEKS